MIIVNVLNRSAVVDLEMERIKLLENAIQELHEVKMKHATAVIKKSLTEAVLIVGMITTVVTLAACLIAL